MNWIKEKWMQTYNWLHTSWHFMFVIWAFPPVVVLVPWLEAKLVLTTVQLIIAIAYIRTMQVESRKQIAEINADTERLIAERKATIARIAELDKRHNEHPLADPEE